VATRIRQAHRELMSTTAGEVSFSENVPTRRPYVLVFLPAAAVDSVAVQSSDLPAEAKDVIQREIEHRDMPGALLGFVQVDRSVWQPLPEGVDARAILFTWKQVGEDVSVRVQREKTGVTIVSVR
jgi:hypothetical protein